MREIKFRAWDVDEQEMIYGMNKCLMNWDGLQHNVDKFFDGDIPVMQYTGLKDKNKVVIYEGDLIKNNHGRICEVKWLQGCGVWDAFVRKTIEDDSPSGFNPEEWWRCVEVIGNIYENPELIKSTKEAK